MQTTHTATGRRHTKERLISGILQNSVYLTESGVSQHLRKALRKLSEGSLETLTLFIAIKIQDQEVAGEYD